MFVCPPLVATWTSPEFVQARVFIYSKCDVKAEDLQKQLEGSWPQLGGIARAEIALTVMFLRVAQALLGESPKSWRCH